MTELIENNTTINNKDINESFNWLPYKWSPIPDKHVPAIPMNFSGGFSCDTHGNVHREFDDTQFIYESNGFGLSAYQAQFSNGATLSVFSRTGSTSGYWNHAINYLFGYNYKYKTMCFADGGLYGLNSIVVLNMDRKNYGDRIRLGSLKVSGTSTLYNFEIISLSSANDSRITRNNSITSVNNYPYFFPFFDSNNELLIYSENTNSLISNTFIGKLFPYDGLAIFSDNFVDETEATNFVDSITSIQWDTDIQTTEFHAYCIKEPFVLNNTTNPSIFKTSLYALTSNVGYSYGRDGLTGNSCEFIDSISSISTYATTIGLYNDLNELLFVMKMPQPIKLVKELPYSFAASVDYRIK